MSTLSLSEVKAVVKELLKRYHAEYALLFGSYARGDATPDSDIDIIIVGGKDFVPRNIFALAEDLREMTGRNADVFEMREVNTGTPFYESVMKEGIFHEEMKELYIKKDAAYKESIQTAKESLLLYIRMLENSESADPVIEQKLCNLSHALEQVDGKHVYGYLPKEVKAQVDEIVDRLAQLPEVAACYDQWWRLKDEIAGYYGRNTPPHQPLVQQKEFRAIKNFIIREAETICEPTPVQTSTDAEPRESRESSDETPTAVQQPLPEMPRTALPADAVMQLLLHMSRMFCGNMPVIPPALRIDSKRRRRLQEKRMAMGHKRDDHEEQERLRNEQIL